MLHSYIMVPDRGHLRHGLPLPNTCMMTDYGYLRAAPCQVPMAPVWWSSQVASLPIPPRWPLARVTCLGLTAAWSLWSQTGFF